MLELPKVLVGCPVNSRKEYCLPDYFDNCKKFTYPNKEFYFVDNSQYPIGNYSDITKRGFDCDWVNPAGKRNQDYLTESQNLIRKKVLEENFDYFLSLECDLFPPINIIEQLLAYHAPIATAQYFIGQGKDTRLMKMEIEETSFYHYTNRNIFADEGMLEYVTGQSRSKMHGFGCVLLRKDVLEQFPFHVYKHNVSHSDTIFWFEIFEAGIETVIHPLIVEHRNSSWQKVTDA